MAAGQTNYVDRKSGMRVIVGHYMGDKSALDDPRMNLTKGAHTHFYFFLFPTYYQLQPSMKRGPTHYF